MTSETRTDQDVTIIGAGIIGLCCALSLLEKGITVRLIDRNEPGQGTSYGNAGVISPWSFIPQTLPGIWTNVPGWLLNPDGPVRIQLSYLPRLLPWASRFIANCNESKVREISGSMDILTHPCIDIYRRHLMGTGHEHLVEDSYYVHAFRKPNRVNIDALDYRIRKEKGAELEIVNAHQLRDLEPAISKSFKAAILIKGQARAKSPGRIGEVLAEKAAGMGAEFIRTNVKAFTRSNDGTWTIETSERSYNAHKIVMAAGVWSADLLKPLGYKFPLIAERGYHVEFPNPEVTLNNSIMDVDNKIIASSMENGLRVAGTSEFANIDKPADKERYKSLTKLAKAMMPSLDETGLKGWMGHRPSFPDNLPVIGPLTKQEGLYGAFGHSHYGLMMAPKTGQLIADLIAGDVPNTDLEPFRPERFKR